MAELHGRVESIDDARALFEELASRKVPKKTVATRVPSGADDITKGHDYNSLWIFNEVDAYICVDPTKDAAVWILFASTASPGFLPTIESVHVPLAASLTEVNVS